MHPGDATVLNTYAQRHGPKQTALVLYLRGTLGLGRTTANPENE